MDNLFAMFAFQAVLWVALFSLIYYLRKKGAEVRKELKTLKDAWEKRKRGG